MPGSGAGNFTNYELTSKSNPYLAQTQNIAGYNFSRIKMNTRAKSGHGRRKRELENNI